MNIRIIAATNKNLKQIVDTGSFREDLYYRLNVFEIDIPPLRERREDIMILCDSFLNRYNHKYNKMHRFSDEVKEIFLNYSWKGNIRELSHVVERLVVVTKEVDIKPWHLPKHLYELPSLQSGTVILDENKSFDEIMDFYEGEIIKKTYTEHGSTRKLASKLGISQTRAAKLCRKYIK